MPRPALALALIRGAHTTIYVVMAGSVFAILYAGVTGAAGPERLTRHTLVFFAPLIVVGLALVVARSSASLVV